MSKIDPIHQAEPSKLEVSPTTRIIWENIPPEDYPLISMEYNRLLVANVQNMTKMVIQMQKDINGIRSWVGFLGFLAVLSLIGAIVATCNALSGF